MPLNLSKIQSKALSRIGQYCLNKSKDLYRSPQHNRVQKWIHDQGDKRLRLDYALNTNSVVFDIGGYEGRWTSDIYSIYSCTIYIFEPVAEFADRLAERFSRNNKIFVHNFGLSNKDQDLEMFINKDKSTIYCSGNDLKQSHFRKASGFIKENKITSIDLMKINIEGGEYDLLDDLLQAETIKNIKNIQVQFHDFVHEAELKMHKLQQELSKTHHLTYQYPFVWENWELS